VAVQAAMQLRDVIEKLIAREDLSVQQAEESFEAMLSDFVPEQVAAFLVLLRAKVRAPRGQPGPQDANWFRALPTRRMGPRSFRRTPAPTTGRDAGGGGGHGQGHAAARCGRAHQQQR
jgi:anthranilate phosphoribosyltransferase